MNKSFHSVWNASKQAYVAAAETVSAKGKPSSGTKVATVVAGLLGGLLAQGAHAQTAPPPNTLPTGGQVSAGQASISQSGAHMLVQQGTDRAAINWQSFNVGKDAHVQFQQPSAASVTLNRVMSADPSQIFGRISANGQVVLSNPAGVYFGKDARVDVGGIVATTHGMSDADFMAGKNRFERKGSTGKVVNEGEIKAALGGYIALLAPEVRNQGAVIAHMGTVALAAGEAVDLKFDTNNRLTSIRVEPSQIAALVDNRHAVQAPGGLIIISAQSMDRLAGGVVKNSGRIEANGLQQQGGRIVLSASKRIDNTGTISANATTAAGHTSNNTSADSGPAGRIEISAPEVNNSGSITASGSPQHSAGSVQVLATHFTQADTGRIDLSAPTQGGALSIQTSGKVQLQGSVSVQATQDNTPATPTTQGGQISIEAQGDLELNNATLDASGGQGGQIHLRAGAPAQASNPNPLPFNPDSPDAPTAPGQGRLAMMGHSTLTTRGRTGQGGGHTLLGDHIALLDNTSIDAQGATGGGHVLVGGDWQGGANAQRRVFDDPNALHQATTVTMAQGASIDASATQNGDGGTVVLWSDVHRDGGSTDFAGQIQARGGAQSGHGGHVETSGNTLRVAETAQVNTTAPQGTTGHWLLDPTNFTISAGSAGQTASGIGATTLVNNLANNSITIETSAAGAESGTIDINADIVSASANNLTLKAHTTITHADFVDVNIGGHLTYWADSDNNRTGSIMIGGTTSLSTRGGNITLAGGADNGSGAPAGSAVQIWGWWTTDINSNGGNITMRANATTTLGGVIFNGPTTVNAGTGRIVIDAQSDTGTALGFQEALTMTSASNGGSAISIKGITNNNQFGVVFNNGLSKVVQSTGTGSIDIVGQGNTYGVYLDTTQILASSGAINIKTDTGAGTSAIGVSTRNTVLGQGGAIANSSSAINITTNRLDFSASGGIALASSGAATIQPSGASFSHALDTARLTFGSTLSGLTLGKTGNEQAITLTGSPSIAGPISLIGSNITLNSGLTSTASGAQILVRASGNITTNANTSAKTITTNNGNVVLWGDGDANGSGQVNLDHVTVNPGSGNVTIRAETVSWNLGTKPAINGTGVFTFEPSDASFGQGIGSDFFAINSTLTGLNLGKQGNTGAISIGSPTSIAGAINIFAGDITLAEGLTATGTNTITLQSSGNVTDGSNGFVNATNLRLIGGNVTLDSASNAIATLAASGLSGLTFVDSTALTVGTLGDTIGINAAGAVSLTATDLTLNNGITTTNTTTGDVTLNAATLTGSGGIALANGRALSVTQSGNSTHSGLVSGTSSTLTKLGTGTLTLSGVSSYTGATTITSGGLVFSNNTRPSTTGFTGAGQLTIEPSTSFSTAFNTNSYTYATTLTGLTFGKSGNASNITVGSPITISGPISMEGGSIDINANLTSTVATGHLILKSLGSITQAAGITVSTQTGSQTYWADSDNNKSGNIVFAGAATLQSNGGHITLAGGADSGSGTPVGGAFQLLSSGALTINTGNGDLLLRSVTDQNVHSMRFNDAVNFNSGTGSITLDVQQTSLASGRGLQFNGATSIVSSKASGDAINITANAASDWPLIFETLGGVTPLPMVVKSTSAGAINITASGGSTATPMFLDNVSVLSASGDINLNGGSSGILIRNNATSTTRIGAQAGEQATSSSKVTITGNALGMGSDASLSIATTGQVIIQPSSTSFTSALNTTRVTFGTGITALTLGKTGNTSNITIGSAININGPIAVEGGGININANLTSSGAITAKSRSGITLAAGVAFTTNGGNLTFWTDSDVDSVGGVVLAGAATFTTGGGHITIAGGAGTTAPTGGAAGLFADTITPVVMNTGGGDLLIKTNSSGTVSGVYFEGDVTLDSGSGSLTIEAVQTGTNPNNIRAINFLGNTTIRSAKPNATAISITGGGGDGRGMFFQSGRTNLIQSTGTGGNIFLRSNGLPSLVFPSALSDTQISSAGTVTIESENDFQMGAGSSINSAGLTVNIASGKSFTLSGTIAGSGSTLTKLGTGTLTLSGANTYTGATTVSAGTLRLGAAGDATNTPLGTAAAGTVVASGATLDLNGFTLGTAEALTLNGTGLSSAGALTNSSATAATYSGLLTLGSDSTIRASSGHIVLSNAGTITGSGFRLTLDGTSTASSLASILGTGAGTLTKLGTGTWTLAGDNTFTGITTITAGTLQVGNGGTTGTLGSGAVTNNAALTFNRSNALTVVGNISGTGTLTNLGAGVTTLTGVSSYTGATTITSGGLVFSNNTRPSTTGFTGAGQLTIEPSTSFSAAFNTNSYTYATTLTGLTFGKSGNTADITVGSAITISGPISMEGGNIALNGNLTSTLSGAAIWAKATGNITSDASRTFQTNNGHLTFWADSDANGTGAIAIGNNNTLNSANGSTSSGLSGGGNITLAGGIDTNTDGIPDGHAASSTLSGISLGASTANSTSMYSGGGDVIVRGRSTTILSGNFFNRAGIFHWGSLLVDAGQGAVNFDGTSSTFYGINFVEPVTNTTSGAKLLQIISAKTSGDAITITGTSAATHGVVFNYNNPKEILATGGGGINITGSGAGSDNAIFLSNIDILATSGDIVLNGGSRGIRVPSGNSATLGKKAGTGITTSTSNITLTGDQFSINSPTTVDTTGTLTVQPSSTSFSSPLTWPMGNLTIASGLTGLTLGKSGNTADITIGSATSIAGPINVFAGALNINAGLTTTNATTGNVTFTAATVTGSGGIAMASGRALSVTQSGNSTYSGIVSGTDSTLTKLGAGTLTLTGANSYTGATTITTGTLQVGSGSTTGTLGSGTVTNNAALTFNRSNDLTVANEISGTGALTKLGAGALTLSGASSYTGATTVSAGTLRLGAAGDATNTPLGTAAAGTVVAGGATLDLNGFTLGTAEALTINGTGLSSAGALTNSSATAATYSGLLTLGSNSTIRASSGHIVLSNTGTITGTGFGLTLDGTSTASSLASIVGTGTGTLVKSGTGTWTLTGNNTYTGTTTINAGGTLQVGDGGTSGALGSGSISNSAALTFNRSNDLTVASNISGTGSLTKLGGGTLTISGVNGYSGATTISAGIIKLGATNSLGAGAPGTTIASGAALDLAGFSPGGTAPITISGTGVSNGGVIFNSTSTGVTFSGPITLGANASIRGGTGALRLAGTLNGAFNLDIGTTNANFTQSGVVGGTTPLAGYSVTAGSGNVTLSSNLTVAGSLTLNGNEVTIQGNLTSTAMSGNGIAINAKRILQGLPSNPGVFTVRTSGANILYEVTDAPQTSAFDYGIQIRPNNVINADGGDITLTSAFAANGVAGSGDNAILFSTDTIVQTRAGGDIRLLGDVSNSLASATAVIGINLSAGNNFITESGDIHFDVKRRTSGPSDGLYVWTTSPAGIGGRLLSSSGTIQINDLTPAGSATGTQNSINLARLVGPTDSSHFFIGAASGTAVTSSTSNITIQAQNINNPRNMFLNTGGNIVIEPVDTSFSTAFANTPNFSGSPQNVRLGKSGNTADITVNSNVAVAGPLAVYGGAITLNSGVALTATNSRITLQGTSGKTVGATTPSGTLTANELLLLGGNINLQNASNLVGTVAASGVGSMLFTNSGALNIGTVGTTQGINATGSGTVAITTVNGNLSLLNNVASGGQLQLWAGSQSLAGDTSGGNVIRPGSATVSSGGSARTIIRTGSIAGSTGLAETAASAGDGLVGFGSGNFRYNGVMTGLGSTGVYLVYREQPTVTLSGSSQTITYGTTLPSVGTASGLLNGDTLSQSVTSPSLSGAGLLRASATAYAIGHNLTGLGYNVSGSLGTITVNPKALTVSGLTSANKTYDGNTTATLSGTAVLQSAISAASGVSSDGRRITGDTVSLSGTATGTFNSKDVAAATTVSFGGLSLSGADAANYTLTPATASHSILAKALTISAPSIASKVYDGSTAAGALTLGSLTGLVTGESVTVTGSAAALSSANAGSYTTTVSYTLGDGTGLASNYSLANSTNVPATIGRATLTVRANDDAKFLTQSDTTNFAGVSYTGFVNGETASVLSGTPTVTRSNANNSAGTYTGVLQPGGLTPGNYQFNYVPGDFTIVGSNQMLVRVSNASTTYGNAAAYSITSAAYFNGTNVVTLGSGTGSITDLTNNRFTVNDGASGSATFTVVPTGALITSSAGKLRVGSYQLRADNVVKVNDQNFSGNLVLVGSHSVDPKTLTASITGTTSKVYDGNTSLITPTLGLTGLETGDLVSVAGTGQFASRNAGINLNYSVGNLTLSGTDAGNYNLAPGASLSGTNGTITAKTITLNPQSASKTYDGASTYTASSAELNALSALLGVEGDTVTAATFTFDDKNVGNNKTLTASGVTIADGNGGNNYTVTFGSNNTSAITRLNSVTWIGGASGNWFDPANWAGGAVPDLANVANVVIPSGVTVSFGSTVVAPAQSGAVSIDGLTGAGGNLTQSAGTLNVGAGGITLGSLTQSDGILVNTGSTSLDTFNQSGGSFTGTGNMTTASFAQTGGSTSLLANLSVTQDFDQASQGNVTVGGNANITDTAGGLQLGNLTSTGTLSVSSTDGAVTQASGTVLTAQSTSSFTATQGGQPAAITLGNAGNDFVGAVSLNGSDVNIVDVNALTLGTVNAAGNLTLNSNGALNLGASTVGGNLSANSGNGNITQTGPLSVTGTSSLNAGTGDVTLTNAANDFVGAVSASGVQIALRDANALTLGTVAASGDLSLTSNGDLNLGTSTVGGNLSANSGNGNITQTGALSVVGTTGLSAGTGSITLNDVSNNFGGAVTTVGNTISILGTNAPAPNAPPPSPPPSVDPAAEAAALAAAEKAAAEKAAAEKAAAEKAAAEKAAAEKAAAEKAAAEKAAAEKAAAEKAAAEKLEQERIRTGNVNLVTDSLLSQVASSTQFSRVSLPNPTSIAPLVLGGATSSIASGGSAASGGSITASSTGNSSGITIDVKGAQQQGALTMVAVSLPKGASTMGTGFSFVLPNSVRAMAGEGVSVQATQVDGNPLPAWLKFDRANLRFEAAAVPDGAFPMQLALSLGGQRLLLVISERTD